MNMDRRSVLGLGGAIAAGVALAPGLHLIAAPAPSSEAASPDSPPAKRWAMLIDTTRCAENCTACTTACRAENNVPLFGDPDRDIHWIRKVELRDQKHRQPPVSLPVLCNHCENPPCVHVCPTEASFIRHDGLVLVDKHRCIGCRYCMIACPYKARSLVFHKTRLPEGGNPKVPIRAVGVVEKCTFCAHRLDDGQKPACVEACAKADKNAMIFGDINDPNSEISQRLLKEKTQTIRADLGLKPQVYYKGI
ncbi:MAG: 4Fe-4S dicluster domain-containing protein [Magnetococcales bacterium]|nr:4Fe-4S dicluster domain-containing protein [Magnetococcales bacterium]MBF0437625.1 4Fe-4S dicluster domain-containing protein [Magnetococcales bacterium]